MKRVYLSVIVIQIFFLSDADLFSQTSQWKDFTNSNAIFALCNENNTLWVGTSGGLVKVDMSSGNTVFYNRGNSGISSNSVTSISIDKNGNKWIAGYMGLSKFDGTNWTTFDTSNSALLDNNIDYVFTDRSGNIWAGTYFSGPAKFDGTNWITYNTIGLDKSIFYFNQDKAGNIWMGTGSGVAVNSNGSWTFYTASDSGLPGSVVNSIEFDTADNAWIGTNMGLAKYDGKNWTTYTTANSNISGNFINTIKIDAQNNVWVGTNDNGLDKFDGTNWTVYNTSNSGLTDNGVYSIYIDGAGTKWIGTLNGLVKFDGTTWTKINTSNSGIPSGNYGTPLVTGPIVIDKNNNKWIGGAFLVKFDGINWTQFNPATLDYIFSPNDVTSVAVDASDSPWVLSTNSVYYLKGNKWNFVNSSLAGFGGFMSFNCIAIDDSNNKWIGTPAGLARYDGTNWTIYSKSNSHIPSDVVSSVLSEGSTLWLGTSAGLVKFEGGVWTTYTPANITDDIMNLTPDASGNLWMSAGINLIRFDGSSFSYFKTPDSSTIQSFQSIATIGGNVWVGTDRGLFKFDGTNWTSYNTLNSRLTNDLIRSVAADKEGNLWLATGSDDVLEFNPGGIVTSVKSYAGQLPGNFELYQNYPNPFNPSTIISYQLSSLNKVTLKVFDILGREISTLVNKEEPAGKNQVEFNGTGLSSGVYFYSIEAGSSHAVGKMMLMK